MFRALYSSPHAFAHTRPTHPQTHYFMCVGGAGGGRRRGRQGADGRLHPLRQAGGRARAGGDQQGGRIF